MYTRPPFALLQNFLDPPLTSDGKPYAPYRFNEIEKERYLITKYTHTSYLDTGLLTPREREDMLKFIIEDLQREQKMREQAINGQ